MPVTSRPRTRCDDVRAVDQQGVPGAVPVLPSATGRRCPGTCARERSSPASPRQPAASGARPWAVPGAHSPRAGATVPGAGNPAVPGHPARLWPSSPQLAAHVTIRRTLLPSPRSPWPRPEPRTGGSAQRTCRFERRRSRHRHPEAHGRCPAHPWQATGRSGASTPPTYPPCECRLPAGLTQRDGIGIGDSGRASGARREGLDHWSSGPGGASAGRGGSVRGAQPPDPAPGGPFLTSPGLLGPCARACQASKHGANMGTNRAHKK
jgi:hypothetical protein